LEPLSEVRQIAKRAEIQAKSLEGKDALAIIAVPRSGAEISLCDHWDPLAGRLVPADGNAIFDEAEGELQQRAALYIERQISPSFAYALRDLLNYTGRRGLTHLDGTLFALARALANKKEARPAFLAMLGRAQERAKDQPPEEQRAALQRLCDQLLVIRPMARAMREAQS